VRALNRATLARQLLLHRTDMAPLDAVRHLVGLQAQVPHNPYTALWARLDGFLPEALSAALEQREVVRINVMQRRSIWSQRRTACCCGRSCNRS
jgi:hypothetical protein